ncbi:amidohydrolase family protein [Kordiimonas aquimaris]|uniref:amidohydrolase family protein n=1 Tax=Kordiimonas aquimaris TaxID=707591 RepID=UPI0021CE7B1E|nr:amidohydrolase family protein [Kordiimonas aquimaris]
MRFLIMILLSALITMSAAADTLFSGVTAITMEGDKVIENAYVYVKDGRITYVGASNAGFEQSADAEIIDGNGKFLIPGLAEMHGHLPQGAARSQLVQDTLFLYLAGGVTTVRGMLGNTVQFDMRKAVQDGEMAGPALYLAAPSLNGNSVSSVSDGVAKVKKYKRDGWDLLKIHPGLSRAEYDAIADTAHEVGIPFGGHVPADVGIQRALEKKQTSIDHMDGFIQLLDGFNHTLTDAELQQAVDLYNNTYQSWIVPTHPLFEILIAGGEADTLAARFENKYMPRETRETWKRRLTDINKNPNAYAKDNRNRMLQALYNGGAKIVMGSDAPQLYSVPGFSIWREIESLVDIGLSPSDILAIATRNAGEYFKEQANFGTIENGKRADLVLLNNDPRRDARNLFDQAGVMAEGRWYSRSTIDARLADIAARNQ